MDINELKQLVRENLERKMTMGQQVDFAKFCKQTVNELLQGYVEKGHENASKSTSSTERENHYREIDYVGEKLKELSRI